MNLFGLFFVLAAHEHYSFVSGVLVMCIRGV